MALSITVTDAVIDTFYIKRKVRDGQVKYFAMGTVNFVDSVGTVLYTKSYQKVLSNATVIGNIESMISNFITAIKTEEGI